MSNSTAAESRLVGKPDHRPDHHQARKAQRRIPQPRRLPPGQHPTGRLDGCQRLGQQQRAQPGHPCRVDRVQFEGGLTAGLLAGAHPQHRQPQQPVQQPRLGLHRANPVARHGDRAPAEYAGTQRHVFVVDAVGGEKPTQHAEYDRHAERRQRPDRVAGCRPQHHGPDEYRELAQHLVHRMHQQHPRAEAVPIVWPVGHVASSPRSAAMSVSCATTRSATSVSNASMCTAPAEDAVVTVTLASPNSRSIGPR